MMGCFYAINHKQGASANNSNINNNPLLFCSAVWGEPSHVLLLVRISLLFTLNRWEQAAALSTLTSEDLKGRGFGFEVPSLEQRPLKRCSLQNAPGEHMLWLSSFQRPLFQFRNLFLDQASSLNGSNEKITQQHLLKLGVFYFLKKSSPFAPRCWQGITSISRKQLAWQSVLQAGEREFKKE